MFGNTKSYFTVDVEFIQNLFKPQVRGKQLIAVESETPLFTWTVESLSTVLATIMTELDPVQS